MADAGFIKVAQVSEIRPGEMIAVEVADEQVLLVMLTETSMPWTTSAHTPMHQCRKGT
ncbi:MAG: hypothetical protein CM1200mP27_05160 [Chloroflexota bacterium]|nr:MAG: hypothetical protein CM1200mP27_05160 [Chloroflexota bacterium]